MAVAQNFSLIKSEDGILSVSLQNPTNIAAWSIQFEASNRFGSESGLIFKSANATYQTGQSGITYTNTMQGQFNVQIKSVDTSGFDPKNYAFAITRTDVGNETVLTNGYFSVLPSIM